MCLQRQRRPEAEHRLRTAQETVTLCVIQLRLFMRCVCLAEITRIVMNATAQLLLYV